MVRLILGVYQLTNLTGKEMIYGFIKKLENRAKGHKVCTRMLAYLDISQLAWLSHRIIIYQETYFYGARTRQKKSCVRGRMLVEGAKIVVAVGVD